jgi:hypothetical protein
MFPTAYPNHLEANYIAASFSKFFNFVEFNVNVTVQEKLETCVTTYTAKGNDNWDLIIEFCNGLSTDATEKQYSANIKFHRCGERSQNYDDSLVRERRKKYKDLLTYMTTLYSPNFDNMVNVLKLFFDRGVSAGLFKTLTERKYQKIIKSHFKINHYHGSIHRSDNNYGTISFNKLIQKGTRGYNGTYFKDSYMSVSIEYLVHSDNTVHPYFRIRLPYSSTKKGTCIMPLSGEPIIYFMPNDDRLKKGCIDQMTSMSNDEDTLTVFFDEEFNKSVKNAISSTLNISKSELSGLSIDELKEYFLIVEMLKV